MTIRFVDPRLGETRRYRMVIDGRDVDAASGKVIRRESPVHPGLVWSRDISKALKTIRPIRPALLGERHAPKA